MRQIPGHPPAFDAAFDAAGGGGRAASYPPASKPGEYDANPARSRAGGAGNDAVYDAGFDAPVVTADFIKAHLEDAGRTLLALPSSGPSTRLRTSSLEIVQTMTEAYGWAATRLRPPVPSAAAIDRMDAAYAWLALIPDAKYVLRRIVAARSLVHPLTERHLYPWRRLGAAIGADHKAVQRWWGQGVDCILAGLRR